MNVMMRPRQTLDEFLAWERQQELAYEFDGASVRPMNGGTISHYLIAANLLVQLRTALDQSRFRIVPSGVKVIVGDHVRYPDLVVAARFDDTRVDIVPEPLVVVEVTSPSSTTIDAVVKNLEYRSTGSIQQYVILAQDAVAATVWLRDGENWVGTLVTGDTPLHLPPLDVTVRLVDLYEGVSLPPDSPT